MLTPDGLNIIWNLFPRAIGIQILLCEYDIVLSATNRTLFTHLRTEDLRLLAGYQCDTWRIASLKNSANLVLHGGTYHHDGRSLPTDGNSCVPALSQNAGWSGGGFRWRWQVMGPQYNQKLGYISSWNGRAVLWLWTSAVPLLKTWLPCSAKISIYVQCCRTCPPKLIDFRDFTWGAVTRA